jgi:precorrin-8X/cobalt-precorrin-8 methylmutase
VIAKKIVNTRSAAAIDLWGDRLAGLSSLSATRRPHSLSPEKLRDGAQACGHYRHAGRFRLAAESKDALAENSYGVPFAIVRGRLGGSAMTAAALNALARPGL